MLRFQTYKNIPLEIFLGALNIAGIGSSVWKMLIDHTGYNMEQLLALCSYEDILNKNIEGIGETRAKLMYDGLVNKVDLIVRLMELGIKPEIVESAVEQSPITGYSFCVTGSLKTGRTEFHGMIKGYGGIIKKGVSGKLDYLIIGEKVGATKINKAKQLGTKVITEAEFFEMLAI